MEVFERELKKLVDRDLSGFDAEFSKVRISLCEHMSGDTIPGDCESFDWYVGDALSELHRITATRRIYLNLIKAFSAIACVDDPVERAGSLLEFSFSWRDSRFSVPTVYAKRASDEAIPEAAYRMAADRVRQALYAEQFKKD